MTNRRNRLIAVVRTAAALTDAQSKRLATVLEKKVGQPIRINVQIDPTILGGVSIKFADELVDGSVVNRLANAGRALWLIYLSTIGLIPKNQVFCHFDFSCLISIPMNK